MEINTKGIKALVKSEYKSIVRYYLRVWYSFKNKDKYIWIEDAAQYK